MLITNKHISRRAVLKGMGATVALPLLEAMVPARALLAQGAAATNRKLRFVALEMVHGSAGSTPIGIQKSLWAPASKSRPQGPAAHGGRGRRRSARALPSPDRK